jgi:DNA-binding CsgD family transcriptional regulator
MLGVLTPRQHDVMRLYAAGHPRAEISRRLGIAIGTIDVYIAKARNRLGFESRRECAAMLEHVRVDCVWRSNGLGIRRGDAVRVTGGRYAGRVGTFWRIANATQAYVVIGGGRFALRKDFIEALA